MLKQIMPKYPISKLCIFKNRGVNEWSKQRAQPYQYEYNIKKIFFFILQAKGHDVSRHILACFGGAGGQHACSIARILGIKKIFIHKYASILSAYGMALADVVEEIQEPSAEIYTKGNNKIIE